MLTLFYISHHYFVINYEIGIAGLQLLEGSNEAVCLNSKETVKLRMRRWEVRHEIVVLYIVKKICELTFRALVLRQ